MKPFLRWLKLFFVGDPYPETPETIARAKAANAEDRTRYRVDCDGHPLLIRGLSAIQHASQETTNVVYFGEARRKWLAKHLIEECGQLTGPAFSFERKEQ